MKLKVKEVSDALIVVKHAPLGRSQSERSIDTT